MDPADDTGDGLARIGVLDRNRTVLGRVTRVIRAAAGLQRVAADTEPGGLRARLSPDTRLIACEGADLELALEWCEARYPRATIVTWSHGPMDPLLACAGRSQRVRSVLGWPSYQSMPRSWELALAVRRTLQPANTTLAVGELFAGPPVAKKLRPRSSIDRDQAAADIGALAERAGAQERTVRRITEVSHELLMNAMYDAPVDHYGEPRYALDRRATIVLDDHELPTARVATDGTLVVVQVNDPFGRLAREHVIASLRRGQTAAEGGEQIIDSSNGGAGLGLWRIYAASAITLVDVVVGHATSVTAVFDIDVNPREARTMPSSLHLFGATAGLTGSSLHP